MVSSALRPALHFGSIPQDKIKNGNLFRFNHQELEQEVQRDNAAYASDFFTPIKNEIFEVVNDGFQSEQGVQFFYAKSPKEGIIPFVVRAPNQDAALEFAKLQRAKLILLNTTPERPDPIMGIDLVEDVNQPKKPTAPGAGGAANAEHEPEGYVWDGGRYYPESQPRDKGLDLLF